MDKTPLIWHYGLMAERWSEAILDAPELPFFEGEIRLSGQPALDLACGTGRLLLPLLRTGIDIDGCDLSGDMLHYCRAKAERERFTPNLYEQPMHSFEISRKYKTIYICDSFGLAGGREDDLATLERCYDHLEKGGTLLLNIQAEYTFPESWKLWSNETRETLPQPWPLEGSRRVAGDGSESIAYFRHVDIDPLEQTYTQQVRLEKWVSGEKVATEEYPLRGNMYLKNEVLLMLKMAGFREIAVLGDYSNENATADHKEIIFRAVR